MRILAALLALAGGAAAADYCDGSGGITHSSRDYSDPTCRDYCFDCSAEQVLAAMAAAPGDGGVQSHGCAALGNLAADSPANRAAIADAGGIEAVTGAMARLPDDSDVQANGCEALTRLSNESPDGSVAQALATCPSYCDGSGGITTYLYYSRGHDPSCADSCDDCSAAQLGSWPRE